MSEDKTSPVKISQGEHRCLWRTRKEKKRKKNLKSFLCTTTALHLRITTAWCDTPDPQRKGWGCLYRTRGSGPGACSAEIEAHQSDSFREGCELETGFNAVLPKLCVGGLAETLGVELLPFLQLLHGELLALVRRREFVD